jgi:hypothetical protein
MKTITCFTLLFLLFTITDFSQNSKIEVKFEFQSATAKEVLVTGSFIGWSPQGEKLQKGDGDLWSVLLKIEPGYYQYKFIVDGNWIPDPKNDWKINDGGDNFNSLIKVGEPPTPKRKRSNLPFPKEKLPEPVIDDANLMDLYYFSWNRAWDKITHGTKANGFVESYIDEGFNEWIYQWDSNFMVAFAMYANDIFPTMLTLDNFYLKQRPDGYIQRVYSEATGEIAVEPTPDEPVLNPPLFAWMELRYYELTGDASRIERVLPVLVKYHNWIEKNAASVISPWLCYQTPLGSGMDNVPRRGVEKGGWVDFSSQMALAANSISKLAGVVGQGELNLLFAQKHKNIKEAINKYCLDKNGNFLFDVRPDGSLSNTTHAGAFWALLSDVLDAETAKGLVAHLNDTNAFNRPHRIPTLAKYDPDYNPRGHYWLGGVWAPVVFSTVKGLEKYGLFETAYEVAENHLMNIANIYKNFTPSEDKIAFEERYDDGYKTIWECYSPEFPEPGTRWDNTFYGRQDFAGWTATGPIALLIENIIGIDVKASQNKINWRIHRSDKHGMKNLPFGKEKVSLIVSAGIENREIWVDSKSPFNLEVFYGGDFYQFDVKPGENRFKLR